MRRPVRGARVVAHATKRISLSEGRGRQPYDVSVSSQEDVDRHLRAAGYGRLVDIGTRKPCVDFEALADGGKYVMVPSARSCENVTVEVLIGDAFVPTTYGDLTQRMLDRLLDACGSDGFEVEAGALARRVEFMQPGGTYRLLPVGHPSQKQQLQNLQRFADNDGVAGEQQLQ